MTFQAAGRPDAGGQWRSRGDVNEIVVRSAHGYTPLSRSVRFAKPLDFTEISFRIL